MNILHTTVVALLGLTLANAASADEPGLLAPVAARGEHTLTVDCTARADMPSLRAVGAVLETNNASRIYGERERLLHTAYSLCSRGHREVVFVRDDAEQPARLALAQAH